MKKTIVVLVVLVSCLFGGVMQPFRQFDQSDYAESRRSEQNWLGAQMITLNVHAGTGVWLSNYVCSWYEPIADLNGNVYDMNPGRYGYITKSEVEAYGDSYRDHVHWSNGYSLDVIYYDDANPGITNSTKAYFLDYFETDKEIYLVMSTIPVDGAETVDSYQFVYDADHDTTLVSRLDNTHDLANNVRVNYGIGENESNYIGREFVSIYDGTLDYNEIRGQTAGGPLPGLMTVCLLSLGTVGGCSAFRKRR